MSYTTQIKQEIANNDLYDHCKRAQLSALIQLTSSLTLSKGGMGISIKILPSIIGIMVAVAVFKESGAMELLIKLISNLLYNLSLGYCNTQ